MRNVVVCFWYKPGSDYNANLRLLEGRLKTLSGDLGYDGGLEIVELPDMEFTGGDFLVNQFLHQHPSLGGDDFVAGVALLFRQKRGGQLRSFSAEVVAKASGEGVKLETDLNSLHGYGLWYRVTDEEQ